jgi:large subunit ribosomal protein L23
MSLVSFDLIKYPLITEKTTILNEQGKYVFSVRSDATKTLVAKAIEEIFAVKVDKVNIVNQIGKAKRFKGVMGKRSDVKKAIVTLAKDNVIDFTGGVK